MNNPDFPELNLPYPDLPRKFLEPTVEPELFEIV